MPGRLKKMCKILTFTNLATKFPSLIILIGISLYLTSCSNAQVKSVDEQPTHSNHLKNEISPYLLQHADNPVNWYPWGEEAFEKARKENKPIFLSIGYSTCHWCHVMNEESFSREDVAKLMNETFVSIKVDSEERPDIDNIYMNISVMMTGSGGHPLTVFMTPDKKPFLVATYLPKESKFGRTGMLDLIPKIKDAWATDHEKIVATAEKITNSLRNNNDSNPGREPDVSTLNLAYQQFKGQFDETNGGFGQAQKFPSPQNLLFLLRYWKRNSEPKALAMVEKTLQAMRNGGIYDHLGFGFHRYSTETTWRVPHFEKMLYDQAMLVMAYTEAFQATGKLEYAQTAKEVLTYVLRDLTAPNGGFYSAEDADSEGIEGKFYHWYDAQLRQILDKKDADLAIKVFGIDGNKTNILYLPKPLPDFAAELKIPQDELNTRLSGIREKLFAAREKRIHPHKDDKILTDWNGLMIAALSKAAQVFDEPKYAIAANRAADFVLKNLIAKDGRILHRFRAEQAAINAHADDYAFFIWGLLELYETDFNVERLKSALKLNADFEKNFWDEKNGGFFFAATDAEQLLTRQKEIYDGAIPSANSVAMLNLLRLSRITANSSFDDKAVKLSKAFAGNIRTEPAGYAQLMTAIDFGTGPSYEVVIVGNSNADDTKAMLKAIRTSYIPNKVVLLKPTELNNPPISEIAEFTNSQKSRDGQATAYVCLNFACNFPTTDVEKMKSLFR